MAVDSVLRQTLADLELLVVDDGSTDGTMAALDGLDDPRLRRLANPANLGAAAARNTGLRAARADWVAFQDSDDEWLPQKLARQMARLAEAADPAVVGCYSGMAILNTAGPAGGARSTMRYLPKPGQGKREGDLVQELLVDNFISTQMLMARRSTLLDIGGFDEALPALEDWDCAIRLAQRGPILCVDEPLVLQTFSDNSLTHSRPKWLRARLRILDKHHELLARAPRVLARHHVEIAGAQFRAGDIAAARHSLHLARRLAPLSPAIWLRSFRAWAAALGPQKAKAADQP